MYKPDDVIHYKHEFITAKEKWDKDLNKLNVARQNGYLVLVLWERDIKKNIVNNKLVDFIMEKIEYEIRKN
jgi:G:T-mismatch repair DNA endonuclease (very short patch repair protein)